MAIAAILEQLQTAELNRYPSEHVHKNDEEYGYIIGQVHDADVETNKLRIGIVVGNGAILSSLPDIPADVVIICDYNPFIHEWTQFTVRALKESESIEKYKKNIKKRFI